MLFLQLNPGEYRSIGDDTAVQVFLNSASRTRGAVNAPRKMTILGGEVRKGQGGERPKGLMDPPLPRTKPPDSSVSSG